MTKLNNKYCFIFIMGGEFPFFHRSSLVMSFSDFFNKENIIIINRPIDLLVYPLKRKRKINLKSIFNTDKIKENLFLLTPFLFIHDQLFGYKLNKIIKKFNYLFFKLQINRVLKNLNILNSKKIVFIMHPTLIDYQECFSNTELIYDCYDEFLDNNVKKYPLYEKDLVEKSNFTFVISELLKQNKEKLYPNKEFIYIPNAADTKLFLKENEFIDKEIENMKRPIVGYVGDIKGNIDVDIIKYIAEKGLTIVIVGSNNNPETVNILSKYDNICFLGYKKYSELYKYIKCFDVGIIPYKLNNLAIRSISPLKMYEYLASNIRIVSTPIPEVINFSERTELGKKMVYIGYNEEDFYNKIIIAVNQEKYILSKEEVELMDWRNRFYNVKKTLIDKNLYSE